MPEWLKPDINLGSILAAVGVLIAIWQNYKRSLKHVEDLHAANVARAAEAARQLAEITTKVDMMYQWWVRRVRHRNGENGN